jgi:hypothetical protein
MNPAVAQGGTLQIDDDTKDWQPGQPVTGTAKSDPITLGSISAGSTGVLKGSFTLPLSVQPGSHTLELSGTGSNGQPLLKSASFAVTLPNSSTPSAGASGSTSGGSSASSAGGGSASPLAVTGGQFGVIWYGVTAMAGGALLVYAARRRRNPFGL